MNNRRLRTGGTRRGLLAAGLTAGLVAGGATGLLVRGNDASAQGTNAIHITLDAQPDAAQDFDFAATGTGITNFVLDDDADPALANMQHFEALEDGLYVVAGPDIPGWSLSALTCDTEVDSDTMGSRSSVSAAAAFRLEGGDSASCTFTYTRIGPPLGGLNVVKEVTNDDDGMGVAEDFSIHVLADGSDVVGSPAPGSATGTSYEIEAGEYTVSEADAAGYAVTYGGDCSPEGVVTVPAGTTATCVVMNDDQETGSITIAKDASPADGTDFPFVTQGLGDGFTLDVDDDPALADGITFENLAPGTYSVSELVPEGWKLVDILCTGLPVSRNVEPNADNTIDIQLGEGSQILCTFVNEKERPTGTATLTITKEAGDAEGSAVSFAADGLYDLSSFSLDDDPATETPESITFTDLPSGDVTITELEAAGWALAAITCRGGGTVSDIATGSLTVSLVDGANVRCTFINMPTDVVPEEGGSLAIIKDAGDAEGSEVAFTTTGGLGDDTGFSLDDDATTDLRDTATFDDLDAGMYTVTEGAAEGWALESITCTDGATATVDLMTGTVSVDLAEDEDVTCTFLNVEDIVEPELGSIMIIKEAAVADGTDFAFTGTGIGEGGFTLDVDDDATYSNSITFDDLEAGNYAVTELLVEGWTLVDVTCIGLPPSLAPEDLADNTIDIALAEGADIVCTFVNEQNVVEPELGSISITKDAGDAADSAVSFTTTGGLEGDLGFTLDDDAATIDVFETVLFGDLAAGSYTVTELVAEGWILESITCEGGVDVVTDAMTGLTTITLAAGENVSCTYVNEADVVEPTTGSITIVKDAGDAAGSEVDFTTTGGLNGDPGFSLDDDPATEGMLDSVMFEEVAPGAYVITEEDAEGWTLASITCEGGANVLTDLENGAVTITLAAGEDVTCTFDNDPIVTLRGPVENDRRAEMAKMRLALLFGMLRNR